jgi:ABC-type nitrate/sulfonate/bicarbonate transport system substrate-binding protein
MNNAKRITAAVCAAAMAFSLAACGSSGKPQETKTAFPITLCLDWTPNTNHTGIYAAKALGYFDDAGLDVTIVQPPEDGAVSVCASGQADFSIDAQDTLAAAFSLETPLTVTAVAALLQHNTSGIISRAGEGMDKPAGLAGHTYSTWNSPIELAILKKLVTDGGGDWSKVKLIPNNITDEASALSEHQTDAVWIFYGWSGINAKQSGLDFDYWSLADQNPTFDYYTPVLIANNDFLKAHPDETKAFLSALAKGYDYASKNPDDAAKLLIDGDDTGSLAGAESLVKASQEWLADKYVADDTRWGYIDPARWNAFYQWLDDNGLVKNKIPENYGFSNDYLPD